MSEPLQQLRHQRRRVRERALTQVVYVHSKDDVPSGFFRIPVKSMAIYSKVQVLSRRVRKPVFVEQSDAESMDRVAYWAHRSILPELNYWLSYRVFLEHELDDRT